MSNVIEFTPRPKAPPPSVVAPKPSRLLGMQIVYEGMSLNMVFNKDPQAWHRHTMHQLAKAAVQAQADREHAERLAAKEAGVTLLSDFRKEPIQ